MSISLIHAPCCPCGGSGAWSGNETEINCADCFAVAAAREDIKQNGTVSWEKLKKETE